jgi:hypothetical protein
LSFSDGTEFSIGALNNDGTATIIDMNPITTTSLRLTVDQVSSSTINVGLSEIEVLGEVDPAADGDLSRLATATASSETAATSQLASRAVDGVIAGWPGDYTKEWASNGGGVGEWIEFNWNSDVLINQLTLFDRPNLDDQILAATLSFSDGTEFSIGALNNDGTATIIDMNPITTTSLRLTVDQVSSSTLNVGLSEIEVLGMMDPIAGGGEPQPPGAGDWFFV